MKTKTSSKKVPTPFSVRQSVSRPFPLAPTLVAAALIAAFFVMAFALPASAGEPTPTATPKPTATPTPTPTATPTPTPTPTPTEAGRMTGGGSIQCGDFGRVTHGFELHCIDDGVLIEPNNLEINWGGGNNFHLTTLTTSICTDSPLFDEEQPPAGFDTLEGTGTGLLNGVPGATIQFILIDDGEPGGGVDMARYFITDASGNVVLNCPLQVLDQGGNHQAHEQNP